MSAVSELRNFVGGEYVEPETDRYADVVDPSTAQVVARAPISGIKHKVT